MGAAIDGLGINGTLLVVGASADPIEVSPIQLIAARRSVRGWASGTAMDSGNTLALTIALSRKMAAQENYLIN